MNYTKHVCKNVVYSFKSVLSSTFKYTFIKNVITDSRVRVGELQNL